MKHVTLAVLVLGAALAVGSVEAKQESIAAHFDEFNDAHVIVRTRNQEIPWTAVRGLKDIVHFPR